MILSIIQPIGVWEWVSLGLSLCLLAVSGFVSMSETAFFALSPADKERLEESDAKRDKQARELLEKPHMLLATLLITNNFVNIVLTLLLAYFTSSLFNFGEAQWLEFVIETVVITFLLLLFGEITPKVYATINPLKIVRFASPVIRVLGKLLYPFAFVLTRSTSIVERHVEHHQHGGMSMDELSQAVELTKIETEEEKVILEGITTFGNRHVSDIMRPRLDIVDIDIRKDFAELKRIIISSGYSRIPVYAGTSDKIRGIIYSKDLLPHLDKPRNFRWQTLIRPAFFVPEGKHLDDLLAEFQEHKIHLAIVVDEYGGTAGLVTLEDILEEVVGDISDEYDDDEKQYTKVSDNVYVFEGKTLLNDFYKIVDADEDVFGDLSSEVETLAGLLLELKGDFPKRGEQIDFKQFSFEVLALEKRRIKTIKVTIKPDNAE